MRCNKIVAGVIATVWLAGAGLGLVAQEVSDESGQVLTIREDEESGTIEVMSGDKVLITQHAREEFRPYLHPIMSPDGKGELTEYSPGHHRHQTGLYWG